MTARCRAASRRLAVREVASLHDGGSCEGLRGGARVDMGDVEARGLTQGGARRAMDATGDPVLRRVW